MATRIYQAYNGPMATTAAPAKVTTGTAIKTLMQLATPSTMTLEVIEWGISFDGSAAATPGVCELVDTVAINATVTAYVAADITKVSQVGTTASGLTLAVAGSGYTASAEGTIVATRQFDTQLLPPTAPYIKQFPLERGPTMLQSEFLRIRVTFGTAINALAYIVWSE
jgi:hypothetical protein